MPNRQHLTEHSVSLFSGGVAMIPASELMSSGKLPADVQVEAHRFHIYAICRMPAFSFEPGSVLFKDKELSGRINCVVDGARQQFRFNHPFELLDGAKSVMVAPYPHKRLLTLGPSGEEIRHLNAVTHGMRFAPDGSMLDWEVLYVGQAYGDGSRTVFDRLKSHETLQKILALAPEHYPHDQIVLLGFEYMPYRIITNMDGIDKSIDDDGKDGARFRSILDNPIQEEAQISLAEAGLIRYFQPKYNYIYRKNFPQKSQKILNECFDLSFSALIVEINTSDLRLRLSSPKQKANEHHCAMFDLHDPAARRSFFSFVDRDGTSFEMPGVISPKTS